MIVLKATSNNKEFKNIKIKKISSVTLVFDQMKDAILNKKWLIGEKIPSELELSKLFGVNRLTVRLALQKLNIIGVLETRVGEGTFVKKFKFKDYIDQIADFDLNEDILEDVLSYRNHIELECIRLAIKVSTNEEKEKLRALLDRHRELVTILIDNNREDILNETITADLDFHHYLCKMAHNKLYINAFSIARNALFKYFKAFTISKLSVKNNEIKKNEIKKNETQKNETKKMESFNIKLNLHVEIYKCIINNDYDTCIKIYSDLDKYITKYY